MSAKQFTYIPQPECLSQVREDINACLEEAGWEEKQMDVSLALGEVLQNIIRYGFAGGSNDGAIWINFTATADDLTLLITDNAPPSDPDTWVTTHRPPEEGGLGLNLIRALATEVRFSMREEGNQAELVFGKAASA